MPSHNADLPLPREFRVTRAVGEAPLPVSVVILTYNEHDNIGACLDSCAWCDDVHVLDSGSADGTIETAQARGIPVHFNPFEGFGPQRNHAIDNLPLKYAWHFHLDADERFTPELVAELGRMLQEPRLEERYGGFLVPSKMIFMGKWLRYSGGYPAYQVRFFHRSKCRFISFGHGQREICENEVGTLREPYLHFNFSKGLYDWLTKHNRYSDLEADEGVATRRHGAPKMQVLLDPDPVVKRRAFKNLSYFLRGRALFRFLHLYLLRRGFLDGTVGFDYSLMIAMYEHWTELKIQERERSDRDATKQLVSRLMTER